MNDILDTILKDTYTLTQLRARLRALKAGLLKQFFGGNSEHSLPAFYQQFNKDNVYQSFEQIEKAAAALPVLTIYLTFEPTEETVALIGSFARKTYSSPALLLDIKLNPGLIAGCSLSWKGREKDYSLRARLEEKKPEILESFKRFLR